MPGEGDSLLGQRQLAVLAAQPGQQLGDTGLLLVVGLLLVAFGVWQLLRRNLLGGVVAIVIGVGLGWSFFATDTVPGELTSAAPYIATLLVLGLLWIVVYYISEYKYPIEAIGAWNLGVGFVLLMAGFSMTMRWR